jgi:spermidine/putrescine transport system ATP-binding protein
VADIDVRLDSVTKAFGETVAVDDLSLDILEGEFFSMLGPSGCGKTTTLRMIGGFEEPTEGTITLWGQDVTGLPPHRRDVNTVFQSYALFPHLDVFDNIAFGLRRKKVGKDDVRRHVGEMLELVDLPGFEKRRVTQLSGGQQQRVALARALVNKPRVLLLDEPLGALDLKLRKQMQLELKRIQDEVGITFIYVTHDQEEAMTMSDRLAVMRHGRIEQIGDPREVYERPATAFVAGFLGASNLLAGEVSGSSNGLATVSVGGDVSVSLPTEQLEGATGRVFVGVRPEKVELWAGVEPRPTNTLAGVVRDVTFVGTAYQYRVESAGGLRMVVYAQNLGASGGPSPGAQVVLGWRPEHTFAVPADEDAITEAEEEDEG